MWLAKIVKIVRGVDMLGEPVRLRLSKKQTYQTFFGGFLTVALTILTSSLFFSYLQNRLCRNNQSNT